ncbi:MAG TPA: Uma2 family endonuclease [Gammaproteobacteria bacterium]|nr:Uma2 family endonuclease [Gammaproteobacteria bacterium]
MNASFPKPQSASRLSASELRGRWRRLLEDPLLRSIPGKLELNEKGAIEVSPATPRHGRLQAWIAGELRRLRPDGTTITECPVETELGIRVPDVVWASAGFMRGRGVDEPFTHAPELCIEVVSPTNSRLEIDAKRAAYFAAGAVEVWLVAENGAIEMFGAAGRTEASSLGIALPPVP